MEHPVGKVRQGGGGAASASHSGSSVSAGGTWAAADPTEGLVGWQVSGTVSPEAWEPLPHPAPTSQRVRGCPNRVGGPSVGESGWPCPWLRQWLVWGLRERSCASTPRDPTSQTPAVGATVPTGCLSPGPDLRCPGVGWTPQPGPGENPAPQPLRPGAPRASSQQRRGGTPGGLPGGVAVPPCPWSAARTRGLRKTPDAHPGDAGLGARVPPGSLAVPCGGRGLAAPQRKSLLTLVFSS